MLDEEHFDVVFVGDLGEGLNARGENSHAVLDVSLHMGIVDTRRQEAVD